MFSKILCLYLQKNVLVVTRLTSFCTLRNRNSKLEQMDKNSETLQRLGHFSCSRAHVEHRNNNLEMLCNKTGGPDAYQAVTSCHLCTIKSLVKTLHLCIYVQRLIDSLHIVKARARAGNIPFLKRHHIVES